MALADAPALVQPAHLWVPPHATTAGPDAADFAASIGITLDPEQRIALDALLAERPDGRWAALEGCVISPRQNLKTLVKEIAALTALFVFGARLVVWTAHEFNTAIESFRDIKLWIDGYGHLSRRVRRISEANGEEGIELTDGRRIRFRARTRTGSRGLTGDVVVLDEGFALQPAHMGSLMPTLSAKSVSGNPLILYGSSAGGPSSAVLRSLRERGRKGGDPSLSYVEWCAEQRDCAEPECDHHVGMGGCALDDEALWRQANLAIGRRISLDFIAAERRSLPPTEFARERLGWWEDPVEATGFSFDRWAECGDRFATLADPIALAVDVSPNSASAAIVACGGPVEVVEHRRGTLWVPARLAELVRAHQPFAVGMDPAGPAGALVDPLAKAGLEVDMLDTRRSQLACAALVDAVMERSLTHRDEPKLNIAVAGARRRQSGDAWKWSRRDSDVDISPLVAATIAHYLWREGPPDPEPFFAFGQ